MKNLKKCRVVFFTALFSLLLVSMSYAAGSTNSLSADTLEYNTQTGIIKAQGHVIIRRGDGQVTGNIAFYNSKTDTGYVKGNVQAQQKTMHLTANEVQLQSKEQLIAIGNVHATDQDKVLNGKELQYNTVTEYVVLPQGGTISTKDGQITAMHLEAYLKIKKVIATGHVHIIGTTQNLDAYSDKAVYTGLDGKLVLQGKAEAMQNNNLLRGDLLTLYLGKQ